MTAARLSPTANLLRNSKLFALPPTTALPPARPTAEPVADSDTATTLYPIKAALETPSSSLKSGDWGLKRALPLKSTTNTSTPTIRLRRHIDTEAHVADFESAADHVVTLKKWQNVNLQVINAPKLAARAADRRTFSVFHPELDNTTALDSRPVPEDPSVKFEEQLPDHLRQALEQLRADEKAKAQAEGIYSASPSIRLPAPPTKTKRWRYGGPWLAGMSNLEFDTFLKRVSRKGMSRKFDDYLLKNFDSERSPEERVQEKTEAGSVEGKSTEETRGERLQKIKKRLRSDREAFATAIAAFLDLPDGPARPSVMIGRTEGGDWSYTRNTAATGHYKEVGPPRTHPSAGFSYVRSAQIARNDPKIGPAYNSAILPARLLKDSNPQDSSGDRRLQQSIGVGGLVARQDSFGMRSLGSEQWKPVSGGPKLVARVLDTSVQQHGALEVRMVRENEFALDEDNVPYNKQDRERERRASRAMPTAPDRLQQLDSPGRSEYRREAPLKGPGVKIDDEASDILAALNASFTSGKK